MAVIALTDCDVYCDGVELSPFANKLMNTYEVKTVDGTTFASAGWNVPVAAIRGGDLEVEGPQDFSNAAGPGSLSFPDEVLSVAQVGGVNVLSAVPQGGTEGNVALFGQGLLVALAPLDGGVGDLAGWKPKWRATDRAVRGILASSQTVAVTGTGTIWNLGAVAAGQRIWAAVHVLTAGGTTPSVTVKVQSAAAVGFASPTDRITFAAATAKGGQFASLVGPVTDAFWRASWTVSGTGPSFQLRVLLGIQ